jgi:ketosteroid isomerase-like protein
MKRLTCVLIVLAAPALLAQSTTPQPPASNQTMDAAIKAVADRYVKASLAGDAKAIAELYTEDAVEMPPNEPAIKGRAAIQQYYEKQFKGGKMSGFTR